MTMTEIWSFREEAVARIDLRGFEVQARDGAIGRVAQTIEGSGGGYLVIDPGTAMPLGRHLLVPAGLVGKVDVDQRRVFASADREQIRNAPEYDSSQPLDERSRGEYGRYYASLPSAAPGGRTSRQPRGSARRPAGRARATRGSTRAPRSRARSRAGAEPTKEELYEQAKRLDIEGRSKMSKAQLARAVARRTGKASGRRSSAGKASPVEVQSFLEGVGYPTAKRRLLREAERRNAPGDVRATLRRLPDKEFKSPADVSKAIGNIR